MSKSKLSKRQIAGTLLLSSTVIGATASGTASANFMDFMNTIGSVAGKVGNFVSGHAWGVAKEGFSALVFYSLILLASSLYLKEGGDAINQDTVLSGNIKKFSENIEKFIEKINKKLEKNTKLKDELEALKNNLSNKSKNYETGSVVIGREILEESFNFLKKIKEIDKNYEEIETKLSDNINNFIKNLSPDIITIYKNQYSLIDDFINKIEQKSQEEIKSFSKGIVGLNTSGLEDRKKKLSENISNFSEKIDSFIKRINEESEENGGFKDLLLKTNSDLRELPDKNTYRNKVSRFKIFYMNLKYKDKTMENCYEETISSLPG